MRYKVQCRIGGVPYNSKEFPAVEKDKSLETFDLHVERIAGSFGFQSLPLCRRFEDGEEVEIKAEHGGSEVIWTRID